MVWFAFSVQDQVEKYGAYVGIAAFFGLAVLSLLYFSQARELKRLREWAGRAPERARELEQRVVAQATATVARRPPSAPAATGAAIAPPRRLAEMPAPPATQATGAGPATELAEAVEGEPATNGNVPVPPVGPGGTVPAGRPDNGAGDATQIAPPPEEAEPAANGAAADASAPAGDSDDATAPAGDTDDAAAPAGAGTAAGAAGAAAAGGAAAKGSDDREATVPGEIPAATPPASAVPRVTPAQRVGVTPRPQPLRQSAPTATPRGGGGRRPAPPAGRRPGAAQPPREGRSAGTIALLVGLAVLILGGGTWGVSQLLGGDDPQQPPNQPAPPATQTQEPDASGGGNAAQPSPPGETTVAVLNGTTSTGLAGALADQVEAQGYQRGAVATNPDQGIQESTVYYADGERATAREVAQLLSIENVEAIEPEAAGLAPEADIVVLAGADQAP